MAEIVLVHGIAQELKSADTLQSEWLPNLAGGIREAGFPQIADRIGGDTAGDGGIDVRMAFYGSLFRPRERDIQGAGGMGPIEDDDVAEALAREWLGNVADRSRDAQERQWAARDLALAQGRLEDPQGKGAVARRAINFLSERKYFATLGFAMAQRLGGGALAQVSAYLQDDEVRADALDRVERLLDAETNVLIGHSLGSVVAYEAAHRLQRPLPLLVTLGSPLGLRTIVYERVRPQPPGYPPQVERWVNVADKEDAIAAEPDLREQFPAPAQRAGLEGFFIDNGATPHNAAPYLTSTAVGRPIGEALARA
jgi:hypothetical protein